MPMINLQIDRNSSDEESTAESVVSPMRTERFVAPEEPLKYISRIPIFHLQTVQCGEYGKPIQAPLKDTISQGTQTSIDDVASVAPKSIGTQIPDSEDMEYFNPEETLIQQSNEANELAKANSTIQDLNELLKEKNASIHSLQNKILHQTRKINHLIKIIGNLRRAGFRYNVAPLHGNNYSPSNGLKSAAGEIKIQTIQAVPPEVESTKTNHPVVSKATVVAQTAHGPALPRI
ncbi:uncharacterized protein LOC119660531 isoform X2 [Hermetia illucens]|nr:uncharacterized protein LOC119660531 isoform X2 [Hermetia illucens]